ncbi:MAG: PSP1 domain-containing protein [Planctomycetota bacterium]|jgi:cell fate regulator YaaT (PSP1 superfamily)
MSQDENKPKTHKPAAKQMLVRYGQMGTLGWFEHHEHHIPKTHTHVVIKTERGLELGQVVGEHCYKGGQFKSSAEQVENYYCNRTKDFPLGEGGQFVRFATIEDIHEAEHLEKNAINEAKCCQRIAGELNLEMKIIEAEHLFGGERIIFYFTSEGRVDFRDLVKRLAREYQTRIELRQIGSRDEARLISDYESCGQQCCCSRFLKILEPVNMRMAKLQKATLDPSKISGHCGRLKCCLRYEDETYMTLKKSLPKRGAMVFTPKGQGKVVDMQILTQLVVVQDQLGDRQAWPVDEIAASQEELDKKIKELEAKKAAEMPDQIEDMPILTEAEQASRSAERNKQAEKQDGDTDTGDEQKRPRRNRRGGRNRRRKPRGEGGDQKNNDSRQNQQKKNTGDGDKKGGDNKDGQNKPDGQQKKRPNNRNRRNRRNNNRNKQNNNNQGNQNQGSKGDGGQGNQNKPANQPKSSGPGGEQA